MKLGGYYCVILSAKFPFKTIHWNSFWFSSIHWYHKWHLRKRKDLTRNWISS